MHVHVALSILSVMLSTIPSNLVEAARTLNVRNQRELLVALKESDTTINFVDDIEIDKTVTIYGVTNIVINGNLFKLDGVGEYRCLFIGAYEANKDLATYLATSVTINELVLTRGYDLHAGGAAFIFGPQTTVQMNYCVLSQNYGGYGGGALLIRDGPAVSLTGTTFSDNLSGFTANDVRLEHEGSFSTASCHGSSANDASSVALDCSQDGDDPSNPSVLPCTSTYFSYICSTPTPTVVPSSPTLAPTMPTPVPTYSFPTSQPTFAPTFQGPHLNITFCPKFPLVRPSDENCEMRNPSFNVQNSRNIGNFPTLKEGRDYFYGNPLKLFTTLELRSGSGKDIKSARIAFVDSTNSAASRFAEGDYLYFYDTPTITGLYSPGSGVLLIKGKDSLAAYQEALRKVAYRASEFFFLTYLAAGNPIPRNVSISVTDMAGYESPPVYRGFTVLGSARMYTENAAGRLVCVSKVCGGLGIYEK